MANAFKEVITTRVNDPITGQVVEQESVKRFVVKENTDKFYQTYLNFMAPYLGVTGGNDLKVLVGLAMSVEWEGCKVRLTPEKRADLANLLQLKPQTISNSITKLKKIGLVQGTRGDYELDPRIIWTGTASARTDLLVAKGLSLEIKFTSDDDVTITPKSSGLIMEPEKNF